jgi:hypothetical protein
VAVHSLDAGPERRAQQLSGSPLVRRECRRVPADELVSAQDEAESPELRWPPAKLQPALPRVLQLRARWVRSPQDQALSLA